MKLKIFSSNSGRIGDIFFHYKYRTKFRNHFEKCFYFVTKINKLQCHLKILCDICLIFNNICIIFLLLL